MADRPLTDQDLRVYHTILAGPSAQETCAAALGLAAADVRRSLDRLLEWRLLRPSTAMPDCYEAAPPELAMVELTSALQVRALRLLRDTDAIREELGPFVSAFHRHERTRLDTSDTEIIRDGGTVRQRLVELSAQVSGRVLAAHPTLGPPETLQAAYELDRELLDRGVEYRTVVPHSARRQRGALDHVERLQQIGAQVRSAAIIPARMIIMDSTAALVSLRDGSGAALFRAVRFVDFLHQIFDHLWEHAKPFDGGEYDEQTFGEIELAILDQLADGRSDDHMARRLGISTRTLRRYITEMYRKLGVETRFQLGMKAAQLHLSTDEESPPTGA